MKPILFIALSVGIVSIFSSSTAFSTSVDVTGNIKSTGPGGTIWTTGGNIYTSGGSIYTTVGYIQAQTFFYTPGYVQGGQYLSIGTYGSIGNYLKVGGGSYPTAAKAVQIGPYASASAYNSLVVGQYNVEEGTAGAWTFGPTEPLFVAGNGVSAADRKNAFSVYKDGTITMGSAQGDISMGQFGN